MSTSEGHHMQYACSPRLTGRAVRRSPETNSFSLRMPFFAREYVRRHYCLSRIHCTICSSQKILHRSEMALCLTERTLRWSPKMIFLQGFKGTSVCISRSKSGMIFRESSESLRRCTISLEGPLIGEFSTNRSGYLRREDPSADMSVLCTSRPEGALCLCVSV